MSDKSTHALLIFLLVCVQATNAQEYQTYVITFTVPVFNEHSSEDSVYTLHHLKADVTSEWLSVLETGGSSEIRFRRMIPDAIPGDVIRYGRRTGRQVIVPDMSLIYYAKMSPGQYETIHRNVNRGELDIIESIEIWVEPQLTGVPPNDPMYHVMRGDGVDYVQWELRRMGFEDAWSISEGSSSIVAGVIDCWKIFTNPAGNCIEPFA